jgi:hypothetical protein
LEFSAAQTGGERRICTLKTVNGHKPIKNHNMHHPVIFCEEAKKKEIQLSVSRFHHSTYSFNRTHENFIKTKNGRDFFHNPERRQESFPDELQRIKPSQD